MGSSRYLLNILILKTLGQDLNIPVQRQYAIRWNRLSTDRFFASLSEALEDVMLRSGEVETVKVHHLRPGLHEVLDELLLRVRASVDLGQSPELGVGTED